VQGPPLAAANFNLTIEQGETYTLVVTWRDSTGALVNLTGYTGAMMLRTAYDAVSPTLSLTSPSSGIVLGGALGTATVTMTAAQTAALVGGLTFGTYVYDLEVTTGAIVTKLIRGLAVVQPEATK